jgi:hypothetical protein
LTDLFPGSIEGGRTTTATSASPFGNVLKISEDGLIFFFRMAGASGMFEREDAYHLQHSRNVRCA